MPRRKKGRDKRRSSKIRQNVPKDLPTLNVIPFQRIGNPEPGIKGKLVGVVPWEQRVQPQPTSRSLEDAVGVMYMSRKVEKVSLEDFEQELERSKRVTRRKRADPMRTIDFSELQHNEYYLNEYRQYEGKIYYTERRGAWYITLASLLIRIGPFEAEITARTWAQRYLGRKYFKGEESGA